MENNPNNYISLQEATKYCPYSQEYLSLRARQGKLKAVKFGRNWVTKKEWLEEYLKNVEEYNNFKIKKVVAPPENLPVGGVEVRPQSIPALRFGFVVALVFVSLMTSIFHGRASFQNVFETANPYVIKISQASDLAAKEIFEDAKNFYAQIPSLVQEFSQGFDKGMAEILKSASSLGRDFAVVSGIAEVKEIITEKLCLEGDDGETICLDKEQLKELLEK